MRIHVIEVFHKDKCLELRRFVSSRVLLSRFLGKKKRNITKKNHKHNRVEKMNSKEEINRNLIGDEELMKASKEEMNIDLTEGEAMRKASKEEMNRALIGDKCLGDFNNKLGIQVWEDCLATTFGVSFL
jgi:hypothetical protein